MWVITGLILLFDLLFALSDLSESELQGAEPLEVVPPRFMEPRVRYHVHKSPPLVSVLSQSTPFDPI
jgi:hypothetical protein